MVLSQYSNLNFDPNYSLTQVQSSLSGQRLRLNTKLVVEPLITKRSSFNFSQSLLQRDLLSFSPTFCHITHSMLHKGTYIQSKITKASVSTIVHPCKKVMYAFDRYVIPLLDNAPKSQPSRGKYDLGMHLELCLY